MSRVSVSRTTLSLIRSNLWNDRAPNPLGRLRGASLLGSSTHGDTYGDVARNGIRCGKLIRGVRSVERLLELRHVRLKLQRVCGNALQECAGPGAAEIRCSWHR